MKKIFPPQTRIGRIFFYFLLLLGFEALLIWLPLTLAGKEVPNGLWAGWPLEAASALVIAVMFEFFILKKEQGGRLESEEGKKDDA